MAAHELLTEAVVSVEVNGTFTEAVVLLRDGSRLCFCHRVDERWAKAVGTEAEPERGGLAEMVLADIVRFRLNGKHLEVFFADGNWERRFRP